MERRGSENDHGAPTARTSDEPPERHRPTRITRFEEQFERWLSASRALVLVPVVVLVVVAAGAFVYGIDVFVRSVGRTIEHPLPVSNKIALFLVDIDLFLIGATMLIAAIGFYELFIRRIDSGAESRMPTWLQMKDLNDLKARIIGMIVLIVAVTFVEVLVEFHNGREILELGGGVALFIGALTAFVRFGGSRHGND
jgi:uncharacterized protein (TIGR00645 family)